MMVLFTGLKRHQIHAHKYSTINDAVRGVRLHCEDCGSIFYNSTLLEQHMVTHGNHTYTCPDADCSKTFERINGNEEKWPYCWRSIF